MSILCITSFNCLIASAALNQPTAAIAILIAVLIFTTLMFTIEQGMGFGSFLGFLFIIGLIAFMLGTVSTWINATATDFYFGKNFSTAAVLGIRWASIIWPLTVLFIGLYNYNYDKSQEEKAKQEKPVKEKAKAVK